MLLEKQENKVDKWVVMTETYMLLVELSGKCHHLHLFVTVGHSKMAILSNCHPRQGFEAQSAGCECPFTYANKQNVSVLSFNTCATHKSVLRRWGWTGQKAETLQTIPCSSGRLKLSD